jgi:hypothetical protein
MRENLIKGIDVVLAWVAGKTSDFCAGKEMWAHWLRARIELKGLMVAKACNASNLLLTGFRLEIVRPAA